MGWIYFGRLQEIPASMSFTKGHRDFVLPEVRKANGAKISSSKKGVPMSEVNRRALRAYWDSKKGLPSKKRNGIFINCPICDKSVYKNQRDLKRVLLNFCSTACSYKYRDEGKTALNARIRDSKDAAKWRKYVFDRDDYTCQGCGKRGGKLEADHELPFSQFPDLRFEILNGRTLCRPCHQKTPTYGARAITFSV